MAKVIPKPETPALQGKLGDIVYKKINGKLFATQRAVPQKPRTAKQEAWNRRFAKASSFAMGVKRDPALLAFYEPIAKARGVRMREVILSDAFSAPVITAVDLSGYRGQAGGVILVRATDNFGVRQVRVWLHVEGVGDEYGQAEAAGDAWRYTATQTMPAGTAVRIVVSAFDRPGNETRGECVWPACGDSPVMSPLPENEISVGDRRPTPSRNDP